MEAEPTLGLLQTVPMLVGLKSYFGRNLMFASGMFGRAFAFGLAAMQGECGPFWGHNAIIRTRAFASSCGLPELDDTAAFGGHILSHDSVEAVLMARAGWRVECDPRITGSYEAAPRIFWATRRVTGAGVRATCSIPVWLRHVRSSRGDAFPCCLALCPI